MNSGIPNFPPCSADLPDDWREALLNERTVRLGGPLVAEVMGEWLGRVDLTATRTIRMINSTDKGKCSVDPAPKRSF